MRDQFTTRRLQRAGACAVLLFVGRWSNANTPAQTVKVPLTAADHSSPAATREVLKSRFLLPHLVAPEPTNRTGAPPRTIRIATSAQFRRALEAADGGDIIELEPGRVFRGNFVISRPSGPGGLTIRSGGLAPPVSGSRTTPQTASRFAVLESANSQLPVVRLGRGANGIRISQLELRSSPSAPQVYTIVELGDPNERLLDSIPRNLAIDHVWIHGFPSQSVQRCISLQTGETLLADSWIDECHARGFDSQGIAGWNGPGPYRIENNFVAGAGENIMFGGADPARPSALPMDIVLIRNHIAKPVNWRNVWTVKNLVEIKAGIRVLIAGNVLENCWADAQNGAAILLRSVNQDGNAPWVQTRFVLVIDNIVRHVAIGLNLTAIGTAHQAQPMSDVVVSNNLWSEIGTAPIEGGVLWQLGDVSHLIIDHNSGIGRTHGLQFIGGVSPALQITANVFGNSDDSPGADFSVSSAEGRGFGTSALAAHATDWRFRGNVSRKGSSAFPYGNTYVSDLRALEGEIYPLENRASRRAGANTEQLAQLERRVVTGVSQIR